MDFQRESNDASQYIQNKNINISYSIVLLKSYRLSQKRKNITKINYVPIISVLIKYLYGVITLSPL